MSITVPKELVDLGFIKYSMRASGQTPSYTPAQSGTMNGATTLTVGLGAIQTSVNYASASITISTQ